DHHFAQARLLWTRSLKEHKGEIAGEELVEPLGVGLDAMRDRQCLRWAGRKGRHLHVSNRPGSTTPSGFPCQAGGNRRRTALLREARPGRPWREFGSHCCNTSARALEVSPT